MDSRQHRRFGALSSGVLLIITSVFLKGSQGPRGTSGQAEPQPTEEASSERTYGFAALANHPASCGRGHSDVGFQLHLFFGVKEVFFFQLPEDPPLGLRARCD